jgi:O-antigen/teichoic acid export membrane protein
MNAIATHLNSARLKLRERPALHRAAHAVVSRGISTVASFALLLAASNLLPTEQLGLYVFLFSLGGAAGLIASGGLPLLLLKHMRGSENVATARSVNDALLKRLAGLQMGWLALAAFVCAALYFINPAVFQGHPWEAAPLFAYIAAFAIGEMLLNFFRVEGKVGWALMPRENLWRLISAATLFGCMVWGVELDGGQAFSLVAGVLFAAVGVQFVAFQRHQGSDWLTADGSAAPDISRKDTVFFSLNTVFNAVQANVETLVIGLVIGLEEAAFFFVALRLTQLLLVPLVAIDTIGVPMINRALQDRDTPKAQWLTGACSLASFGFAVLGGLSLIVLGPFILSLFKPEFLNNFEIVIVMTISAIVQSWFGPATNLLMIGGGERFYFWLRLGLLSVGLLAYLVLGTMFGLVGIVAVTFSIIVAEHVTVMVWARRHIGVDMMASSYFTAQRPDDLSQPAS